MDNSRYKFRAWVEKTTNVAQEYAIECMHTEFDHLEPPKYREEEWVEWYDRRMDRYQEALKNWAKAYKKEDKYIIEEMMIDEIMVNGDRIQRPVDIKVLGIMQCIGLKDRNKIDIYDGDILRRQGCWEIRIEYEDGAFWVRDLDRIRFINQIRNIVVSDFSFSDWEVYGNIYKNAELLI